jgi:hypothetical protein
MNQQASLILAALLTAAALLLAPASAARADMIPTADLQFSLISGDSPLADQVNINLQVSKVAANQIRLDFKNLSGTTATVSHIYLQDRDGVMGAFNLLNTGPAVFEFDKKPKNFPGGNNIGFETTFSFGAKNPSPKWGIEAGESFQMLVDLTTPRVAAEFMQGLGTKSVRVGLHVQALEDGNSLSLVSTPPGGGGGGEVPEPGTMALLGSALVGGRGWSWRRRRQERAAAPEA